MSDDDLPEGYRWATAEETEQHRPDAIVVPRSVDSSGRPYTQDEADIAVPSGNARSEASAPKAGETLRLGDRNHLVVGSTETITADDTMREWIAVVSDSKPPRYRVVIIWENGNVHELVSCHSLVMAAAVYAEHTGRKL